jgi:hypothetical protein
MISLRIARVVGFRAAQVGTRLCKHIVIGVTGGIDGSLAVGFLGRLPTIVLVSYFGTGLLKNVVIHFPGGFHGSVAGNFSTIERMPAAWRAAFSAASRVDVFISSPLSPTPLGKRDAIVKTVIRKVRETPSPVRFAAGVRFAPTLS